MWYETRTKQYCKAWHRVLQSAESISGGSLLNLEGLYNRRCRARAMRVIKDPMSVQQQSLPTAADAGQKADTEELSSGHTFCYYGCCSEYNKNYTAALKNPLRERQVLNLYTAHMNLQINYVPPAYIRQMVLYTINIREAHHNSGWQHE